MTDKRTDSDYKNSHKKSAKSFVKSPCKVLDIKPRSAQNSQLHSFTASQLHSFTASQLRGTCAQIKQSNTAKFSHTIRTRQKYCLCAFFYLLKICGHLRCRFAKNSPRRTKSTPAGVFCTLLASAPPIFKSSVSTGMDVGGCPTDWD